MEDVRFGMVLEVAEVQPVGREVLQQPHHKLLGFLVPPGLPEDGGMAQVLLQTPVLSLTDGHDECDKSAGHPARAQEVDDESAQHFHN